MKNYLKNAATRTATVAVATIAASLASPAAATRTVTVFASGKSVNATAPDSIALGKNSIWVSYGNSSNSTGLTGYSTVVQYDLAGRVLHKYDIPGSADGLKIDPETGLVWALQNQDGNSTLTLIDTKEGLTPESPIPYAVTSSSRGYDDVVFRGDQVFLSYTNPSKPSDATIQMLDRKSDPLTVHPVLTAGAKGVNLATFQGNQPTAQNDPDSLKLTPWGDLMLSSGDDGQLIFVRNPGTRQQEVGFLQLLNPSTGRAVSGLDDAVFVTAERGTFYLTDTSNNRILKIEANNLEPNSLYASVGSLNELASVNLNTGKVAGFVTGLNGPHGLLFVPQQDENEGEDR